MHDNGNRENIHQLYTGIKSKSTRMPAGGNDIEFMSDTSAAVLLQTPRGGRLILWVVVLFLAVAMGWASWAKLDEVTTGAGTVIPSRQVQVVQNLEGGIVASLLVSEGQLVEKGEVLLQIDDTRFSSSLRETRLQYMALKAKASRLMAEVESKDFSAPADVKEAYPQLVQQELRLFRARQEELKSSHSIINEQMVQIKQEVEELKVKKVQLSRSIELVRRELEMTRPLVSAGAISQVEVLRLEREVNDLQGEMETIILDIPKTNSKLDEAREKLSELGFRFRNEAHVQLNEVNAELSQLSESSVALEDRVKRTAVRSPVKGTVKQVLINTVGGVVQPGMELVEVVPLEDSLLIEARVRPKDIAFLHPGQDAVVKITAYDFAIYSGLDGKLEHISADTIEDDKKDESYYLVRVRTGKNYLGTEGKPLPIIPGMQAEVDIITGKKRVLEYLFKPLLRAKERALRER